MAGRTGLTAVEVWFQDEARVGQQGSLSYVWAPIGSRPPMVRDTRRDSVYLFGAICPERAVGAAVILPAVSIEGMNLHLEEISSQVAPGAVAAVICDGAGWHATGRELTVPDNIVLVTLPPYSPELNPAENLWHYMRSHYLANRAYRDYDHLLDAGTQAYRSLTNEVVKSVCRCDYINAGRAE